MDTEGYIQGATLVWLYGGPQSPDIVHVPRIYARRRMAHIACPWLTKAAEIRKVALFLVSFGSHDVTSF